MHTLPFFLLLLSLPSLAQSGPPSDPPLPRVDYESSLRTNTGRYTPRPASSPGPAECDGPNERRRPVGEVCLCNATTARILFNRSASDCKPLGDQQVYSQAFGLSPCSIALGVGPTYSRTIGSSSHFVAARRNWPDMPQADHYWTVTFASCGTGGSPGGGG